MDLEMWPVDISEETDESDVQEAGEPRGGDEWEPVLDVEGEPKAQEVLKPEREPHVEAHRGQDHDASWMPGDVGADGHLSQHRCGGGASSMEYASMDGKAPDWQEVWPPREPGGGRGQVASRCCCAECK